MVGFCLVFCLLCPFSRATVWLLRSDEAVYSKLHSQKEAAITKEDITATFRASDGVLSRSFYGFGVDSEDTNDPDGIESGEWIDIVFDRDVNLTAFSVSSWSRKYGDRGVIEVDGVYQAEIKSSGYQRIPAIHVPAGVRLTFRGIGTGQDKRPNGWSLTSFTTETAK